MVKKLLNLKILFFVFSLFISVNGSLYSQSGIFESYAILNVNGGGNSYYDLNFNTALPDFDGNSLGTFTPSNSLVLNGAENKTYKCGADNILNGWLNYRIYLTSAALPAFSSTEIFYTQDDGTLLYCSNSSNDQTWRTTGANIDVLNGLSSGDYYLEIYTHADVDITGDSVLDFTHYVNNSGANYRASFRVDNPPQALCLGTLTVQLDASGNATIDASDIDNGSNDDFDTLVLNTDIVIDITSFDCSDIGTPVTVTLTVTDSLGQTDTCTAVVTVTDNENPTIATLGAISVNSDAGVCTYDSTQLTAPVTTDNCGVDTVVATPASLGLGSNTVTWTVTDDAGNTNTSTQTVTVVDNENPTIATLGAISVNSDAGVCTYDSTQLTAPVTTDNCGVDTVVATPASLGLGLNTVTWTVTDDAGNTNTSTQTVTVVDNENPTIAT